MQYYSLQHWTLLSPPGTSMTEPWPSHFILVGAVSNCSSFFPSSILDAFWPGELIFQFHLFLPFLTVHGVFQARILEWVDISSSQWTALSHNSTVWPVCLGWSCMAWLTASLNYASPFALTRLWSMKGTVCYTDSKLYCFCFCGCWLLRGWRK